MKLAQLCSNLKSFFGLVVPFIVLESGERGGSICLGRTGVKGKGNYGFFLGKKGK